MVTSTCSSGLWLKTKVVVQVKGEEAGFRLYFMSAIFIRAAFQEKCHCMVEGNAGCKQTWCGLLCVMILLLALHPHQLGIFVQLVV